MLCMHRARVAGVHTGRSRGVVTTVLVLVGIIVLVLHFTKDRTEQDAEDAVNEHWPHRYVSREDTWREIHKADR